ncbi:14684_t:CDS:2 [Funneliformis mosseae]|uniref:14684_t:CDS:1 n=1 Tax=Funneliformis mosseae TaxID=27381 RepID=A0A9N8V6G8_FUNMO|nr:14684_t:CDS:2 [Funneliformis mosseae]
MFSGRRHNNSKTISSKVSITIDLMPTEASNLGCKASKIHQWWENGQLSQNIKKSYDDADAY